MTEYRKTVKPMLGIRPRQSGNEVEQKETSTESNPDLNTRPTRPEAASSVWCTPQGKNTQKNEELYQIKLVLPS